jgi:outer membrane protein assembly factor BamB
MIPRFSLATLLLLALSARADNWPGWRGPGGSGTSAEKNLPLRWSATENVRWKAAVPGAGVSAPVVWGERVFVTSSDGRNGDRLHLFCYHRDTGRPMWHRKFFGSAVSEGQFVPGGMAVPTPATDGKRVYALFGTGDLICVDVEGKPVWARSLAQEHGPFRNRWGMAASPLLLDGLLVVQVDHWGGSYLLGIHPVTGSNRWRTRRDAAVNWTSPVAIRAGGKTQILTAGTFDLKGYSADTGAELWSWRGLHMQCIPTPIVRGDRFFVACGQDFTSLAFRLESSGPPTALWKSPSKGAGVPSPLVLGAFYYYLEDAGWVNCLAASSGKRQWRGRLNTRVQASLVAGDGKLYVAGSNGTVIVLQAGATFKVLARNDVGEGIVASPALSQGRIFLRGEKHLFCIGGK